MPENILVFREGQRFREVLPVEIPYMGFQINSFQAFFVYRQTSWVVFISWEALYQISIKVPENHKKKYTSEPRNCESQRGFIEILETIQIVLLVKKMFL